MTPGSPTNTPRYVIDTNCFISGINELYGEDVFPSLWGNIAGLLNQGEILLIQEVIAELEIIDDGASVSSTIFTDSINLSALWHHQSALYWHRSHHAVPPDQATGTGLSL